VEYAEAFFVAATEVRLGADVRGAMQRLADQWDAITDRYGRGNQRSAYLEFLKRPGAKIGARGRS
jgi:hypothetical protein